MSTNEKTDVIQEQKAADTKKAYTAIVVYFLFQSIFKLSTVLLTQVILAVKNTICYTISSHWA